MFTFIIDAQLTIKSACLDIERATFTDLETENTEDTYWALGNEGLQRTTHEIDRLHIKCGVTMDDGTIQIVGRGRTAGMTE